jgi:hypothetical protein
MIYLLRKRHIHRTGTKNAKLLDCFSHTKFLRDPCACACVNFVRDELYSRMQP